MSPWFLVPEPRPAARLRLFCIPFAGRGASLFVPWRTLLPDWIELVAVQLPGRERRLAEPPLRRISAIADTLAGEIAAGAGRPFALFGHSMGALVAFETARALRRREAPPPRALVLSGRRAPTAPETESPIHTLPDDALVAAISARYGGIPQIVLDQPDMMRIFIPIMRADMEAIETYRHAQGEPALPIPFLLYGGRDDPQTTPESLAGWRDLTAAHSEERVFPGGHFYLQHEREALIQALVADLAATPPSPHRPAVAIGRE